MQKKKAKENSKHDAMPYDAMQSDAKSVKVKESHTIILVFLRHFLAMTPRLSPFLVVGIVECC